MSQGQGHATTYAQIIATELGLPSEEIQIEEGDTDKAPYGAGTWGSRSTPVGGAAAARAARKIREKAKKIAAHLLEVGEGDLEWEVDRFKVVGNPSQFKTMKDVAMAAHTSNIPDGMEKGLDATEYYDPPNMTFPFGAYVCVVDINRYTGETKVRRFYALDDCGDRINPMIIEGQIHGGLTEAFAVAMGQAIPFDENGNHLGNSFMDYFLPTAVETPKWETDFTVTPSPHHPIGAKGVAESPHVGGIPCFSNAIVDASRTWASRTWTCRTRRIAYGSSARPSASPQGRARSPRRRVKVELAKTFPLPGAPDAAWRLLQDVEAVAAACPGRRSRSASTTRHYKGTVTVRVGPATLVFRGDIEVKELDAATRTLRLSATGSDTAGSAGSMDLTARIDAAEGGVSTLNGSSVVSLSGKAAAFGARMVDSVADQILAQFAGNFAARLPASAPPMPASDVPASGNAATSPQPAAATSPSPTAAQHPAAPRGR